MEIKLFGKSLFSYKSAKKDTLLEAVSSEKRESKYLPDFATLNLGSIPDVIEYVEFTSSNSDSAKAKDKPIKAEDGKTVTPKEVYNLKLLDDTSFKIIADSDYVDAQIAGFKDKLELVSSEEYDMRRGVTELSSILMRMENRKLYAKHIKFFEQYPYTSTAKINKVIAEHSNLKLGQIAQFVADMPKEAVKTMKDYSKECAALCGKQAVFYIIADKADFKKTEQRRDPILLAQSPFGHVWQILGAWDKEMMLLSEL